MKIIAASDVAGSDDEGQANHISFLVGDENSVNTLYKNIGVAPIHMSKLSESNRIKVYRGLKSLSNDIHIWCFHVSRQHTEEFIFHHKRLKFHISRINVHRNFDKHLFLAIKEEIKQVITPFKQETTDLRVQVDSDMLLTVKNWKMHHMYKGKGHELADAVAWFNQRSKKIDCKIMDLRDEIKRGMKHDMLR